MRTNQLIAMLASGVEPVQPLAAPKRLGAALLIGLPFTAAIVFLLYHVRPDLVETMHLPMFWLKFLFPLAVAAFGLVTLQRLARPGTPLAGSWWGMLLPILAVWALALVVFAEAPADQRAELIWGRTWRTCAISIAFISSPVFIALLASMRTLAPTRPAWSGAVAGATSAGVGAAVYALHCPELAAPFMAIWYVAGMAVMTLIGAAIGARWLRW